MKLNNTHSLKAGFSLVEMLVVIAVIGIIAAIAVPNIGRINDSAKEATARRNAQNFASVAASASAAGLDFKGNSVNAKMNNIIAGAQVTDEGPFKDTWFKIPGVSTTDRNYAAQFLELDANTGQLIYDGSNTFNP
ncbi:MAG: prepilin-type N-terminal cleavage/methylation domain-containing protein [Verrucomicrobiales bacterium]|nr:prepilin-type N-terminal cleavage/methylation domain-containing protein [Verrucomicrobiales bacterium]